MWGSLVCNSWTLTVSVLVCSTSCVCGSVQGSYIGDAAVGNWLSRQAWSIYSEHSSSSRHRTVVTCWTWHQVVRAFANYIHSVNYIIVIRFSVQLARDCGDVGGLLVENVRRKTRTRNWQRNSVRRIRHSSSSSRRRWRKLQQLTQRPRSSRRLLCRSTQRCCSTLASVSSRSDLYQTDSNKRLP